MAGLGTGRPSTTSSQGLDCIVSPVRSCYSGDVAHSKATLGSHALAALGHPKSRAVTIAAIAILAWGVASWALVRPFDPVTDWNGWRQADTQTIALNLMRPGSSILQPQIAWGGSGPGYVETEFQLYAWTSAALMHLFGPEEWVSQSVSMAAICIAAFFVWFGVFESYGLVASAFGLLAFFGSRSVPFLATVMQPDAMALAFCASAWFFWMRYVRDEREASLVWFAILGTLAMLVKPTESLLGIASFVHVLIARPQLLKRWSLWLAWTVMVALLGAHLAHAKHLFDEYGNTFGVLSGGDSKLPQLKQLFLRSTLKGIAKNVVVWGVSYSGVVAAVYLLWKRKADAVHWSLACGLAAMTLIALRYTSQPAGEYYFAPGAILGAYAVGAAVAALSARSPTGNALRASVLSLFVLLLGVQMLSNHLYRRSKARTASDWGTRVAATGRALGRAAHSGDLVVVRSTDLTRDPVWGTANNYQDPRLFYLSSTHGWVLGLETSDPKTLVDVTRQGAKFFADPNRDGEPNLDAWLKLNARLLPATPGAGRIWSLQSARVLP